MTEKEKYKHAQNVFSRITTELTDLPDPKFEVAMQELESWWDNIRNGNVDIPTPNVEMR